MSVELNTKRHVVLVVRHPVGGIRTYMEYIYNNTLFDRYRFTVIFPKSELTDMFVNSLYNQKFKFIICSDTASSMLLAIISSIRRNHVDIIHSHGFTSGIYTAMLAKIFMLPHIMTTHDVLLEKQFSGFSRHIKKVLLQYVFNLIDVINPVSYDVERNIMEMLPKIKKNKLVTILNGVDIYKFKDVEARNIHSELDLPDKYFLIGFLGRFMSQKGFRYLIDAVEILSSDENVSNEFIVVSIGSGGFIREEKAKIKKKGLVKHFVFLPAVINSASSIKGMNVIVIPSLWEACPLLPMEVLVSGIPLIATSCIGLREVVAGSHAFIVKPGDARSLANAIIDCMHDDRINKFQYYVPQARKRFDSMNTAKQLAQVYDEITNKNNL